MKSLSTSLFVICALLLGPVLCTGHDAYTVRLGHRPSVLRVFTYGHEAGRVPVVEAEIDNLGQNMIVLTERTRKDETHERLHLPQILRALWEFRGMELNQMNSLEFAMIVDTVTLTLIKVIRQRRGLTEDEDFSVKELEEGQLVEGPRLAEFKSLSRSRFGKVARRVTNRGGRLVDEFKVRVEEYGPSLKITYLTVMFR